MNNANETVYYIILIVLMVIGIALTFVLGRPKSEATLHGRIRKALNSYARIRKFRVLDQVTFETKKGAVAVDHVMVGYFGVLFVNDLLLDGDYYGELTDAQWVCSRTESSNDFTTRIGSVANPLLSAQACAEAARDLCARQDVFNLPMECIAVKAYKKGDFVITGAKDCVFNLRSLRVYLQRSWFDKDTGLDVDQICSVLLGENKA